MPIRDVQSNAQNIATETTAATLAKEVGGNLDTIAGATSSADTKLPADPAREGGNLQTVATAVTVGPVPVASKGTIAQGVAASDSPVVVGGEDDAGEVNTIRTDNHGHVLTVSADARSAFGETIGVNVTASANNLAVDVNMVGIEVD